MTLAGLERLGIDDEPNATWIIPSTLTARQLYETEEVIQRHRDSPIMEYGEGDPIPAEEMLRRKPTARPRRAEYDDDNSDDGIVVDGDNDLLFPAGGPTNTGPRTAAAALEELKKKRRKRRASITSDDDIARGSGLDEETREHRRIAREAADLEKRKKIKSAEFVYDSEDDEEADTVFFQREEARRKGQAKKVMEVLRAGMVDRKLKRGGEGEDKGEERKKKRRTVELESEGDDSEDVQQDDGSSSPQVQELELNSQSEVEDTQPSTPLEELSQGKGMMDVPVNAQVSVDDGRRAEGEFPVSRGENISDEDDDDDEDEPIVVPSRRRQRAAMMFESDSE